MRSMSSLILAMVHVLTLAACGASIDVPDELDPDELEGELEAELGSLEQALGAGCGNTGPVQRTFNSRATAFTATATMQAQGCQGDSYMFTIQSYNTGLEPLENPTLRPLTLPTTEADCVATELRFYVWTGSTLRGSSSENGDWKGRGIGCELSLSAPASLAVGNNYKFGISGIRPSGLIPVRLEHPYR